MCEVPSGTARERKECNLTDAAGVRLRRAPFTAERVKAALAA
jgi:hypothetical protein